MKLSKAASHSSHLPELRGGTVFLTLPMILQAAEAPHQARVLAGSHRQAVVPGLAQSRGRPGVKGAGLEP